VTTTNTTGGASIMGSFPYPRNGILKIDYEFILIFKKPGNAPKPTQENKELSKMTTEEWNTYFSGHWNFAGAKQEGHIAMFPEELPARLIKMFAFHGDTVLDPFMGSGTTSLAAKNLGRNSVGYEINPEFIEISKRKLDIKQPDLAETEYEFLKDKAPNDFTDAVKNLPYIFVDTHKLDKKIDPKKLQFGSKIDQQSGSREEYYSVTEVISPELIRLSNNAIVRLLGVKEKVSVNGRAKEYLIETTKGQKVFMKYDSCKFDEENHLLCYLYLQNKTFINARLIKAGLAEADTSVDYKYKEKFQQIGQ
jgi:site-specific DNA-methyltransferase (adenine-specific)